MTENLLKKLRTSPREERKKLALELALTRKEEGVEELIRMVEGEIRIPGTRSIKTFGLKLHSYYVYSDQLAGIDALGETSCEKALDYLAGLYDHHENYGASQGLLTGREFIFIRAKGQLEKEMRLNIYNRQWYIPQVYNPSNGQGLEYHSIRQIELNKESAAPHFNLLTSIKKLNTNLSKYNFPIDILGLIDNSKKE